MAKNTVPQTAKPFPAASLYTPPSLPVYDPRPFPGPWPVRAGVAKAAFFYNTPGINTRG
jgi:hypothetical protein